MIKPKKIGNYFKEKIDRIFTAVFSTSGGLLLAQFPQFLTQYLQRLGGHIDEALSASAKYKLPELAQRAEDLRHGLDAIVNAPALYKLPKFFVYGEWTIVNETIKNYTPGMAFNEQGLYYLGAGMVLGMVLYGLIKYLLKKGISVRSSKNFKPGPPPITGGFQGTQYPGQF